MNINELTLGQIKEISNLFSIKGDADNHPYKIGKPYLIRTVTMTLSGRLKSVGDKELVLEEAAWIADTGRFSNALLDMSVLSEIEPFPAGDVIIGRGSIIDAVIPSWDKLPTVKK